MSEENEGFSMIVQVMAISNLVPVPLSFISVELHIRSNHSLTKSIKLIVMLIQLRDICSFKFFVFRSNRKCSGSRIYTR